MRRLVVPLAIAVALGALGCESNPPAPTPSPTADASAAPAFDYLPIEASWKNRPLELASAVAFSRGGRALHVSLSTHPLTCADIKRGVQKVPDEIAVDLTLAPLLSKQGEESWAITRARFGPITRQGDLAPVTLSTFHPKETIKTTLKARLSFPPDELVLNGRFDIDGCGLRPWSTEALVLRQSELNVTLAGRALSMNGATLETAANGERVLRISTEPRACGATAGSDATLIITLAKGASDGGEAADDAPTSVRAEGYTLPRPIAAKDAAGLKVKPVVGSPGGAPPTGDETADPAQARFDVDGALSLSGYALTIAGTVTAQRCAADTPRR